MLLLGLECAGIIKMKSTHFSRYCCRIAVVLSGILFTNCSISKEVIIMSKPQTASIYVNGEYQGTGYVKYYAPKGVQSIKVSCSTDGIIYDEKEVFISKKKQYINVCIDEFMRYDSQPTMIKKY